ncbi:hypothetical protein [Pseudogulbenkiania sp. NH8B]|uniref:hypothetical protein n=1 Tax=Pseudogulbenkiania sp. (strain NH8B) TaxID=748280 RepID=UPI0011D21C4E|nr:hypothetical protein [Pseudogulbenkiania sp. NH8B]
MIVARGAPLLAHGGNRRSFPLYLSDHSKTIALAGPAVACAFGAYRPAFRSAEFPSRVLSPDAATVPDYIVIRQGTFDLDQLGLPGSIPRSAMLESALFAMTGNSP